ncbi:MAG: hypothetical protein N2C14_04300, partial [Planctomycetales bacterium]
MTKQSTAGKVGIPARFLFRFAVPCLYVEGTWADSEGALDERYRLPDLGALEDVPFATDARAGWNEQGLFLAIEVEGKRRKPWCRGTRLP